MVETRSLSIQVPFTPFLSNVISITGSLRSDKAVFEGRGGVQRQGQGTDLPSAALKQPSWCPWDTPLPSSRSHWSTQTLSQLVLQPQGQLCFAAHSLSDGTRKPQALYPLEHKPKIPFFSSTYCLYPCSIPRWHLRHILQLFHLFEILKSLI